MKLRSGTVGWVYFIRPVGQPGPVKIGFARDPEARLRHLEKGSPVSLEIAAKVSGTHHTERRFHGLFAADLWRDEWFHASSRMEDVIRSVRRGAFDTSTLPASVALYLVARRREADRAA